MDERSDKKLADASRTGDRKAYAALVKKYYRHVFLVCLGVLGNIHDAEDIAQEAILKGFVDINRLRDGSRFGPWIATIAKNMCMNLAVRQKRSKKALEEKARQLSQTVTPSDRLQQAIERLPREIRTPLLMYYFDGQSVKNVADKLNISPTGVYVKLRTATKRLHEMLIRQGDSK